MNIASELCYAQAHVCLNGALYQLAISIKRVCLMWMYVHACALEKVCVCACVRGQTGHLFMWISGVCVA